MKNNIFKRIKQKYCKHNFEVVGENPFACGFLPLRGYTYEILECTKCGKRECGEMRKYTSEEKMAMANDFKNLVDKTQIKE